MLAPENGKTKSNVNHPEHYNQGVLECIDVMRDVFGNVAVINFCQLNAFKYVWRCQDKGKCIEDAEKAIWYLQKMVELKRELL